MKYYIKIPSNWNLWFSREIKFRSMIARFCITWEIFREINFTISRQGTVYGKTLNSLWQKCISWNKVFSKNVGFTKFMPKSVTVNYLYFLHCDINYWKKNVSLPFTLHLKVSSFVAKKCTYIKSWVVTVVFVKKFLQNSITYPLKP